jgi:hypothetical protein
LIVPKNKLKILHQEKKKKLRKLIFPEGINPHRINFGLQLSKP